MLANLNNNKSFSESLDIALHILRVSKHSCLNKSPFELHHWRRPQLQLNNLLASHPVNKLDNPKNGNVILADTETPSIYQFNGDGSETDQLIMQTTKDSRKAVSKQYPFFFLERKHQKGKFESAYDNKVQKAKHGTEHIVVTNTGKMIYRKMIS